jgi:Tfp pilus assembly protein PilV
MSQAAVALRKIPTKSPQPAPGADADGQAKAADSVFANGVGRTATRGDSDVRTSQLSRAQWAQAKGWRCSNSMTACRNSALLDGVIVRTAAHWVVMF